MHIILGLIGLSTAAYFLVIRARNAAHVASDLSDMARDVRSAARRFGFKRQTNIHPVETIEEPNLAIAALGTAFLEMDDLPTKEQRDALNAALREQLQMSAADADEALILGHWFVSECHGPETAVPRLGRKLYKLDGQASFEPLLSVVTATAQAGTGDLNAKQREALDEIRRAFRIK
ncbi:hypothetical protein FIU89_06205 [Roseovarius sp. THAF27]|uniref:hypothetical protein n=1 Tax=Roseovarius sp. THAF27 TaxID=2587850 RepID=UPI001268A3D1|nr:hypothetical protein [Roseovarius sp. THAF27]QFT80200.1 hypothetical protein FIU89_06205 [Roseovarius sp. THAF27]